MGDRFLIENPSREGGGGQEGRGAERVSAANWGNFWGSGYIFLFRGRNAHQVLLEWGKKKTNKHRGFWRDTPYFVSRLSHGRVPSVPSYVPSVPWTFCPLNLNFHINQPKRFGCPRDVPNLSLGRFRGIPTTKFLYVISLCRFFLHTSSRNSYA